MHVGVLYSEAAVHSLLIYPVRQTGQMAGTPGYNLGKLHYGGTTGCVSEEGILIHDTLKDHSHKW